MEREIDPPEGQINFYKMKHLHYYFIALTAALTSLPAVAQREGRILDEQGAPVAFANVVSLSPSDSTVVDACVSREDGTYHLTGKEQVRLLRVSAVGYETLFQKVSEPVAQLTLTLRNAVDNELAEASVVYKRPVSKLVDGALVTTVENTTLSKSGNAQEVLKQVPGIIQKSDQDGTLEVIGRGTPLIYINGRQVRDNAELKELRSDEIKSVEVIHNPGAQYDASVSAVVRIVTKRRKGEGIGVDFSSDFEQGKYTRDHSRLKLNYRKDGFDASLAGGFHTGKFYWKSRSDQYTTTPDTLWSLPFYSDSEYSNRSAYGVAEVNYEFNERHSIGVRYQLEKLLHDKHSTFVESNILANGEYYDHLTNEMTSEDTQNPEHSLNFYYNGKWGKGEFAMDADFYASGSANGSEYNEQSAEQEDRQFPTENRTRNRLFATKASYAWPWLGGKVTVGGQYSFTNRHDDYYIAPNDFGIESTGSRLHETSAAGFVQYAATIAKRYQLTAGLRFEHVEQDYSEGGVRIDEQSPTYDNLFPSLSFSTAFGKMQFMASYTSKIQRPSYGALSNNVSYGNRFLLQSGNPNLKPTINHGVNLTAVWNFLQAVVSYDHYKDGILYWGESLPENPSVTKVSSVNKNYSTLTGMVTYAPQVKFWHPNLTLGYVQTFCKLPVLGSERNFNNPMLTMYTMQTFKLPKGYDLTAVYSMTSKGNYRNVEITKMQHYLEAYATKSFFKESLTLKMGVRDILHNVSSAARVYMSNSYFYQTGEGDTRSFYFTVSYNFNAMRDKYKGQSAVEEAVKRL